MSRYFVTDPPVPIYEFDPTEVISDAPPNIIWIKARMDVATQAKAKSELTALGADQKTVELHLGAGEMGLLVHNIVRWEGPDLGQIPCTPENIRAMDPTEPHLALVLEEIARRNAPKPSPSPNPKSAVASGSTSAGAGDLSGKPGPNQEGGESLSHQLATTNWKSPSPNGLAGRLNKSDDSIPITSKS